MPQLQLPPQLCLSALLPGATHILCPQNCIAVGTADGGFVVIWTWTVLCNDIKKRHAIAF